LTEWFEQVKERRKNPGLKPIQDADEEVDLDQNELTKDFRR
jgi:hypothetical protein